jgi:hypothetical protein
MLLEQLSVELPPAIRSLMRRRLSPSEYANFCAVRLFSIAYLSQGLRIRGYLALPPGGVASPRPGH